MKENLDKLIEKYRKDTRLAQIITGLMSGILERQPFQKCPRCKQFQFTEIFDINDHFFRESDWTSIGWECKSCHFTLPEKFNTPGKFSWEGKLK